LDAPPALKRTQIRMRAPQHRSRHAKQSTEEFRRHSPDGPRAGSIRAHAREEFP
jgi:hypothetical protein